MVEYDDASKKRQPKPVYKRVKCPHCDARPKEQGLWQHVSDVHGINQVEQALAKLPDNAIYNTKGSMCMVCAQLERDCSELKFEKMQVISMLPKSKCFVKCTEF